MSFISTFRSIPVRTVLLFQSVTVATIALICFYAGRVNSPTIGVGACFCAFGVGTLLVLWQLRKLVVWESRIQSLNQSEIDGYSLAKSSGTTLADHGWNRLIEQGQNWSALSQLENAIANQLGHQSNGGSFQLLDAIPEGVAAVDRSGNITYANSVLAAMCGHLNTEEMLQKPLVTELGVDATVAHQMMDPTGVQQTNAEWSLATSGGSRTLRGERRPVRAGDGQAHFVWTIRDVTQQRLAESMREKFLAAATHEFRTPLANIRAYSESLDMGHDFDAESRKRFYNVIQSESVRLSQLVDDLLDISRMQAGGLALENRETDLGRLVEEVANKVRGQIQEKNLQFRVELPPKFPKASVDKGKLTAALVNLLGNAAKYTLEGGRVTFRVDTSTDKIDFTITDTGIGIAPNELPKVFDRFYRSNDDRVRDISGSGLGLALAQEIARLHGGDIVVESTLNVGSTFRMSIPLSTAS